MASINEIQCEQYFLYFSLTTYCTTLKFCALAILVVLTSGGEGK